MAEPVIIVRGEAHLEGPPDLATVAVTLHRTGSDADRVRVELGASSAAFHGAVGPVVQVSDVEAGLGGPRPLRAAFGAARAEGADPDFDFEPAMQSVSGSVTVHYALRLFS